MINRHVKAGHEAHKKKAKEKRIAILLLFLDIFSWSDPHDSVTHGDSYLRRRKSMIPTHFMQNQRTINALNIGTMSSNWE